MTDWIGWPFCVRCIRNNYLNWLNKLVKLPQPHLGRNQLLLLHIVTFPKIYLHVGMVLWQIVQKQGRDEKHPKRWLYIYYIIIIMKFECHAVDVGLYSCVVFISLVHPYMYSTSFYRKFSIPRFGGFLRFKQNLVNFVSMIEIFLENIFYNTLTKATWMKC